MRRFILAACTALVAVTCTAGPALATHVRMLPFGR